MTMKMTLLPPKLATAAAPSNSKPVIPFVLVGGKDVVTAVDTSISRSPSSPGVISFSSWDPLPRPRPLVPAPTKMLKRMERGYRYPTVTTAAVGGGTRLGMLMTTAGGFGEKRESIGRKTAELNWNQDPDQVQA